METTEIETQEEENTNTQAKKWYSSKTIWLNLAIMTVSFLSTITPQIQYLFNDSKFVLIYIMFVSFLNIVLRTITTQPIDSKILKIPEFNFPKPVIKRRRWGELDDDFDEFD